MFTENVHRSLTLQPDNSPNRWSLKAEDTEGHGVSKWGSGDPTLPADTGPEPWPLRATGSHAQQHSSQGGNGGCLAMPCRSQELGTGSLWPSATL